MTSSIVYWSCFAEADEAETPLREVQQAQGAEMQRFSSGADLQAAMRDAKQGGAVTTCDIMILGAHTERLADWNADWGCARGGRVERPNSVPRATA